ncbi:MAG: type 2b secretion system assembly protein PilC [Idiomarinaceae bacterium HL-53]|nr:MAG: type 2b secretion system assembly protein PilC [Idiomarinaceae bacterium HL-53]CUS47379.1 Type II secretory pathway, component PulF [Idiomarinaceae bacterium HL-53]
MEARFRLANDNIASPQIKLLPRLRRSKLQLTTFWQLWFSRWLEFMEAGFDNYQAFTAMLKNSNSQEECVLTFQCIQRLEEGRSLIDVLFGFRHQVNIHLLQQLKFAEQSGALESVLADIKRYYEARVEQHKQTQAAMRYPYLVVILGLLLFTGLKLFILPKFAELYNQGQAELPPLTQFVLTPSEVVKDFAFDTLVYILSFALTLGCLLYLRYIQNSRLQFWLWRQLPAGHSLYLKSIAEELTILARATAHHIPLQDSTEQLALHANNALRRAIWIEFSDALKKGKNLAQCFAMLKLPLVHQATLAAAVESGSLVPALNRVASKLNEARNAKQKIKLELIPQMFMIALSLFTAAIMAALYLPLFQMGLAVG